MHRVGAILGVISLLFWLVVPVAGAEPTPPGPPAPGPDATAQPAPVDPGAVTMKLSDLGASDSVAFYIHHDTTTTGMTFPVPVGLTPVELRARIELPVALRFGNLTVSQDERAISRVKLPNEDQAEIVIPLRGLEVSGGWVNLTLAMTAVAVGDGYCWDDDAPIRLVDAAITLTGAVAVPTSVANFLPPVLNRVAIALPSVPSPAESDAAVQVAAAVAKGSNPRTGIVVVPLPDGKTALDAPAPPFERQIIVKEGGPKGLSLQGAGIPALLISGTGDELAEQARLLSSESLAYATGSKAVADDLPEDEFLNNKTTVVDVTRSATLSNSALWPRVGIELDQTRFGHPVQGITLHLLGSHTPLPRELGGELTVSVGEDVVDRWVATDDGVIDRTVTIPNKLIKRYTAIGVALRTTGNVGQCGDYLPVALRIEGKSTITTTPATPPVPQGMQSFPQALMPRVQFGIGPEVFADTVRAAQIAVGMQRMSGVALTTEVTTLADAIGGGGSAVLISAAGWNDESITLPYSTAAGKLTVHGVGLKNNSMTLTLDPEVKYGSLQTVFDDQRSLLIASSNGAPQQLDDLLGFLAAGRWGGINGRAIVSVPGVEPLTVPNPPVLEPEKPAGEDQAALWWAAGGIAAIAGIGALLILLRAGRTRRRGAGLVEE
jgi:hypothetical protein